MFLLKKLPPLSLGLLLLACIVFGELVAAATDSLEHWLAAAALLLLIPLVLAAPLKLLRTCLNNWLESDTRAFMAILALSFLAVIMLTWLEVFARLLVLLSAGALARLDLQLAGCQEWQAMIILAVICITGFAVGLLIDQLLIPLLF